MNITYALNLTRTAIPVVFAFLSSVANAQQGGTAKGVLTIQGEKESLSVELAHAYYITGPDSFDESKIARSIVFTADDQADAIASCTYKSCAELSQIDGLTIHLADLGMANWWAHVAPVQYSGTAMADDFTLSVNTPERVAGTFRLNSWAGKASIEFDATLFQTFDQ